MQYYIIPGTVPITQSVQSEFRWHVDVDVRLEDGLAVSGCCMHRVDAFAFVGGVGLGFWLRE